MINKSSIIYYIFIISCIFILSATYIYSDDNKTDEKDDKEEDAILFPHSLFY